MARSVRRIEPEPLASPVHGAMKIPAGARFDPATEAKAIKRAFAVNNHWSAFLRAHSTRQDVAHVAMLAEMINKDSADEILVRFFRALAKTMASRRPEVSEMFRALPADWYSEPVYYTYAQNFGTKDGATSATFDDLIKRLDYLEYLKIKNIFILPHYESPGGDGGYDVSSFDPRKELGGREAYERFMREATARGFRVMTDIPANHTSTQHPWFQALLAGDKEKADYYVKVDGVQKMTDAPVMVGGRPRNIIKHPDENISAVWLIFPHASDKNWIDVEVNGVRHQIFHTFYPFQVDLNLQNPKVLEELFNLLGSEANLGNVGKRMDAAPHWYKKTGTDLESLRGTHALQALFKSFERHAVPGRGITLPEVGFGIEEAAKYFGRPMEILGTKTNSEGDGVFAFEMQAALREMIFTGSVEPFWRAYDNLPDLPDEAVWLNMLGHHDELRTDLMSEKARGKVRKELIGKGAMDFAGRGLGGRTATLLDKDPERIANAFFALYMAPGTPVVYYGDEIGFENSPDFMREEQKKRHEILNSLGVETSMDAALDTRDLNRGRVPAEAFDRAKSAHYLPLEMLRALNGLRAERPSMKSRALERIPTGEDGVLALVRRAKGDRPIIALSNQEATKKTVLVPERLLGPGPWVDLLGSALAGNEVRITGRKQGDKIAVELAPFARMLIDGRP